MNLPAELEDPGEEGGAEGDFGGQEEVCIVDRAGFGVVAVQSAGRSRGSRLTSQFRKTRRPAIGMQKRL